MNLYMCIILFIIVNKSSFTTNLGVDKRIRNGNLANIEDFPFVAAIEFKPSGLIPFWHFQCCGTIIRPNWVLTVKHCIDLENGDFRVVTGTAYLSVIIEDSDYITEVEKKVINDKEDVDLGLLKLITQLVINSKVQPIELSPYGFYDDSRITDGVIAGWGWKGPGNIFPRSLWLMYTNVTIGSSWPEHIINTHGYDNTSGACTKDEGAGVIITELSKQYVHGVYTGKQRNSEIECVNNINMRVYSFTDWINNAISGDEM